MCTCILLLINIISFVFHFSKIIMYCIWKQGLEKRGGRSKYMGHL